MEWLIVVLLVLILVLLVVVYLRRPDGKQDIQSLVLLQNQMQELTRSMESKLGEGTNRMFEGMQSQFGESQKLVDRFIKELGLMTDKVARVEETGKQMLSIGDQLNSLQDILKNPKQRGILGEYYLEAVLKNVLPPGSYEMQYKFSDGTIVDAAVFVEKKIIPVDSKFSLENYTRFVEESDPAEKARLEKLFVNDLKLRIQETAKYVQPSRDTMDFAFMFIPHEAIYYDLLTNKVGAGEDENLIQRAASKYHVIIVSPTSFLAYLQTVLQGLRQTQIREQASQIIKNVTDLGKHLKTYEEAHAKLGNALATTVNHFNTGSKEFKKIDKDILRITGDSVGIEQLLLEKPDSGDSQ